MQDSPNPKAKPGCTPVEIFILMGIVFIVYCMIAPIACPNRGPAEARMFVRMVAACEMAADTIMQAESTDSFREKQAKKTFPALPNDDYALDLFTGGTLQMRYTSDALVIFSTGPDKVSNAEGDETLYDLKRAPWWKFRRYEKTGPGDIYVKIMIEDSGLRLIMPYEFWQ